MLFLPNSLFNQLICLQFSSKDQSANTIWKYQEQLINQQNLINRIIIKLIHSIQNVSTFSLIKLTKQYKYETFFINLISDLVLSNKSNINNQPIQVFKSQLTHSIPIN